MVLLFRKNILSITAENLIEWINYIIDNSYISFQGKVYKQVVVIPMGAGCARWLANIFLHMYEYEYTRQLIKDKDIKTASRLSRMFRYQDDLLCSTTMVPSTNITS